MNGEVNPWNRSAGILVVEDSPTQADQLRYLLERHDYTVMVACDGNQALDMIEGSKPSLIISDIVMPGMNGYELCHRIKSHESTNVIPVILLTSLSNPEDVLNALAAGADSFLTKPYSENYLLSNIENILANRNVWKSARERVGVEIMFAGKSRCIATDQQQMFTMLISTYGAAVQRNSELAKVQEELNLLNERLEDLVEERTAALTKEIAERKQAEERISVGFQLETAMRRIDAQILEGADLREAQETACEAIVTMGYRMCWIGQPDPDKTVRPVACKGFTAGYTENINIRWDDSAEGKGPTGIAIRTGQSSVVQNIKECPEFGPWRENAIGHGFLSMAAIPMKTGKGKVIGVLNVYDDHEEAFGDEEVTRLEMFAQQCSIATMNARRIESLRDAKQRLAFHVSRMPLAYIVWDLGSCVVEWNPSAERIFGWNADEAIGKRAHEFVPMEGRPDLNNEWSDLLEGSKPTNPLNVNIRKDGKVITCEWFNALLKDASGNVSGVLSIVHDVTEKTELERQLQISQKMEAVGTLAGGIAHDFNNALTGILGFGELLRERLAGDEQALHDLDEILHCGERAATLTRQLLTFARRQTIEPVYLNLAVLVAELMKLVGKVVGEHIEVKTSIEKSVPTIHADRGQIEQVVMNLCLNSRDAMPEGGRLMVETGEVQLDEERVRRNPNLRVGRYALLTVSDTGIGMDKETCSRVFEPFFTTKGPDKGTGLGLAMVYGIVKEHGGFIHLCSEPGKGTSFEVYLPAVEAPPDVVPATRKEENVPGGTETILLADDEDAIRDLTERILTNFGYKVIVARNGEEAVEIFRQKKEIALVLLDVVMPRKGGRDAFEEMHRQNPRLKVIFMSGYGTNAIRDSFMLIANRPFLQKPFGPTLLARKVRDVLDGK